jgi:mannose-6-phosphate isomerase-like protein (cupin superfamily)
VSLRFVEKPWGYEKHLEINPNYVVKELFMREGNSCSLQYHEKKHV